MTEEYHYTDGTTTERINTKHDRNIHLDIPIRVNPEVNLWRIIHRQQAIINDLIAQIERGEEKVDSLRDVDRGEQGIRERLALDLAEALGIPASYFLGTWMDSEGKGGT